MLDSWLEPFHGNGVLPYILAYSSSAALIHSVVTYLNPVPALRQFSGPNAPAKTPLLAHVYGIKNVYTGLIRFYALYHLDNREVYNLAIVSYLGVLALFAGEYFIWRTARTTEVMFPFVTAGLGAAVMLAQRDRFVG